MRCASIDLGTNTCLLLIADRQQKSGDSSLDPSPLKRVEDHSRIVRLGQGVDEARRLAADAMERTLDCLRFYADRVRAQGLEPAKVVCVATSQARDSVNASEFFDRVLQETGFRFQVISGEEEASATFRGALLPGQSVDDSAVIDIGGGSTEITSRQFTCSIDMGSVRFTERFLSSDPVTDQEFWACQQAIDDAVYSALKGKLQEPSKWGGSPSSSLELAAFQGLRFVAVAGTATTLASWHLELEKFDSTLIDECVLTRGDIHRMVEELKWRTLDERRQLPGIEPKRADVLLAGAMILWRLMELLGIRDIRVSTRGLRYGLLLER